MAAIGYYKDNELYRQLYARNKRRQYDLMRDCAEIVISHGIEAFDKYMLWALNAAAMSNLDQFCGRYREVPTTLADHRPPHHRDVPNLMDQMITQVHQNWTMPGGRCDFGAYVAWHLAWIHPFQDGNGRTARAAAYILVCKRAGAWLPGNKLLPTRMEENRDEYLAALSEADEAWVDGRYNVTALSAFMDRLLDEQLAEVGVVIPRTESADAPRPFTDEG